MVVFEGDVGWGWVRVVEDFEEGLGEFAPCGDVVDGGEGRGGALGVDGGAGGGEFGVPD